MLKQVLQDKIGATTAKEYAGYSTIALVTNCNKENKFYSISYIDNYGKRSNKDYVRVSPATEYTPNTGDAVMISVEGRSAVIIGKYIQDNLIENKSRKEYIKKDVAVDSPGHYMGNIY